MTDVQIYFDRDNNFKGLPSHHRNVYNVNNIHITATQ